MKYSDIMNMLKEHAAFSYTGRFNIVGNSNKQHHGALLMKDGLIVKGIFGDKRGWSAIKAFLLQSLLTQVEYNLISEPESIDYDFDSFTINISSLERSLKEIFYLYKQFQPKLPKTSLRILPSPQALKNEHRLSLAEFQILSVLVDYSLVGELIKNCPLTEVEVLIGLCQLREKGLIKVMA